MDTIELGGDWIALFEGAAREQLESRILPSYLPGRRWFGGKARRVAGMRIVESSVSTADRPRLFLVFVEVAFTSGPAELYFVPLAIRDIDPVGEGPPDNTLAKITSDHGEAWLVDALNEGDFAQALLAGIANSEEIPTTHGTITAAMTTAFDELRGDLAEPLIPQPGPTSSSNSLVFLGERLLLKIFRRLEAGINPDLEVGRFLTEQTSFSRLPRVAGSLTYQSQEDSESTTLAVLQQYVPHQGDGWTHALDELRYYYERVLALETLPAVESEAHVLAVARQAVVPEVADLMRPSLESATLLGKRTAQLHEALASRDDISDFAPEILTRADMELLISDLRSQADRAFSELADHRDRLPLSQQDRVDWLLGEGRTQLDAAISQSGQTPPAATKCRIHGDYHLGQVIRAQDDYILLDFEGEPTRPIAERRRKYSPIRDVAGMLRSFHYAAFAGAFALAEGRGSDFNRLVAWAELWQRHVGAAFLREYLAIAGSADFIPEADDELKRLLDACMLGKAFYELVYELNNRPDWSRIPLGGLVALLRGPS